MQRHSFISSIAKNRVSSHLTCKQRSRIFLESRVLHEETDFVGLFSGASSLLKERRERVGAVAAAAEASRRRDLPQHRFT